MHRLRLKDAPDFNRVWLGWGLYPLKINMYISRTKFESAQKRDAPEFHWGVYYMLQSWYPYHRKGHIPTKKYKGERRKFLRGNKEINEQQRAINGNSGPLPWVKRGIGVWRICEGAKEADRRGLESMKCIDTTYFVDLIRRPSAIRTITQKLDTGGVHATTVST